MLSSRGVIFFGSVSNHLTLCLEVIPLLSVVLGYTAISSTQPSLSLALRLVAWSLVPVQVQDSRLEQSTQTKYGGINIELAPTTPVNRKVVHQLTVSSQLGRAQLHPTIRRLASPTATSVTLIVANYQRTEMATSMRLKASSPGVSCLHVKLPPVKWIHFTMHQSQFLGMYGYYWRAWSYTWKAILLASGVPHDGSIAPARFLLSK